MKKMLFIAMMSLLILVTGCSVPPFNTKAKIEYDTTGFLEEMKPGDDLPIKLVSKNSVGAELKKVKVTILSNNQVTSTAYAEFTSFDSDKILENTVNTFVLDFGSITAKMKTGYYVRIDGIEYKDDNKNNGSLGKMDKIVLIRDNNAVEEGALDTAVANLTAEVVKGVTTSSVYLKWDQHDAAQKGYKVYRVESSDPINNEGEIEILTGGAIVSTSVEEYTDKNVKLNYYYFYRVVAVNDAGNESVKQVVPVYVKITGSSGGTVISNPVAIEGVTATVINNTINLSWTKRESIGGYKVYKYESNNEVASGSGIVILTTGASITTTDEKYTVKDLNPNKYYFFWVTAVIDSTTETPKQDKPVSGFTASASVGAPAVTTVTAEVKDGKIVINWAASTAAEAGYKVYKMTSTNSIFNAVSESAIKITGSSITTSITNYEDAAVIPNYYYFYRVVAVDAAGIETPRQTVPVSVKVTGSSNTTVYTPVSGLTAVFGNNSIILSWTANSAAERGYKVYRMESLNNSIWDKTKEVYLTTATSVSTSIPTYEDTYKLTSGAVYFYRVEAVDNGGGVTPMQQSPVYLKYTTASDTIPAVTGLAGEGDTDSILVTWNELAVSGQEIVGYNVYVSPTVDGVYQKLNNGSTPNIIKENKLRISKGDKFGTFTLSGEAVFIKVTAVKSTGQEGSMSTSIKARMYDSSIPVLESGTEMKVVPYGNTVSTDVTKLGAILQWKNKGVTSYIVERTESMDGQYSPIATVLEDDVASDVNASALYTAIIDGSFMELKNKTAFYRIRCVVGGAIGRPSGVVQVTDYSNMWTPIITEKPQMLILTTMTAVSISGSAGTEYGYEYLDFSDETKIKSATIAGLPLDFAGFKIYMSNEYDKEYLLVGSIAELWHSTVRVLNSQIDPTKPIYVRVSTYDYFGNESPLSLRSSDLN